MGKTCKRCGEFLPLSEYYTDKTTKDGKRGKCKGCIRAESNEWKRQNPELTKQSRAYYQKSHRAQSRAYSANYKRRNRAVVTAKYRQFRKDSPEKHRAQKAVRAAVREGKLVKPSHCQQCGVPKAPRMLHGHHHDYSLRLDVKWLCAYCHWLEHEQLKLIAARDAETKGEKVSG